MLTVPVSLLASVLAGNVPAQSQNAFNPDMSLVFNFGARLSDSQSPPQRRASLREIEMGLAGDVDPFLRTEAYIAFAKPLDEDEGEVEVEEAFGAYSGVGKNIDLRLGKIAGAVGRVNRNHLDQLDFFEYPLIVTEVFGEEGLRAPGVSASYLLPSEQFNEFTLEALVPEEGPLFGGGDAASPVWVGHYRTFRDFTEDFSAQFGATYARGPQSGGDSTVFGLDAVAKLRPQGTGRNLVLESEAYWYKSGAPGSESRFGWFATGAYQLGNGLWASGKVESVELPDGSDTLRSCSLGLTLRKTEFQLLRLEYQQTLSDSAASRNQLVFQAQWVVGPHRAHKY